MKENSLMRTSRPPFLQLQDAESLLHQMEKNVVFELIGFIQKHEKHLSDGEQQELEQVLLEWKKFLLTRYFPLSFRLAEEAGFVPIPPEHVPERYRKLAGDDWLINGLESIDDFLNDERPLLSVLRTPSIRRIPKSLLSSHGKFSPGAEQNDHLVFLYNPEAPDDNWATLALHLRKNVKEAVTAELKYSEGMTTLDLLILSASLLGMAISLFQDAFLNFLQQVIQRSSGVSLSLSFPQFIGILGMIIFILKIFQLVISFVLGKRKIGKLITRNKKIMKSRLDSSTTLIMLSYYQRKRKAMWARTVFKVILERNGADLDEIQREMAEQWEIFKDWATLQRFMSRLEALEWISQDNTGTWNVPRGKVINQPDPILDDQLKDSFDLPVDVQAHIRECHHEYQQIRARFEKLADIIQERMTTG